jgi:biotin synthase
MDNTEIITWLRETDNARLETLWRAADETRRRCVGDEVHLRGLIEFSNYCVRHCHYCGLRVDNDGIERYRMSADEILACTRQAVAWGYGTVVLQSGEDYGVTQQWMAELVHRIKAETPLAVTLSLGERPPQDLTAWQRAGADRYLLRFETSNPMLFARIHPSHSTRPSDRLALLRMLRDLGYEVGSGVMIGIPSQTYDDLARDILLFAELDLDMIGVGPFLPHPETPLGGESGSPSSQIEDQVPNTELMTYKVVALTRLVCPYANIPSTTALATLNRASGRELGLQRGANIVMPNLTPPNYRCRYEIYPAKACLYESAEQCHHCMEHRIRSLGRTIGQGRGDSPQHARRAGASAGLPPGGQ